MTLIDLLTSKIVRNKISKKKDMLVCSKLLEHMHAPQDIICDKLFTFLDRMTSHEPELTSNDLKWPKKIGMLHIKWELKTAVLHKKYALASFGSNVWPQADLHWLLMISKFFVQKHKHDFCCCSESWSLMTIIWPSLTSDYLMIKR